MAFFPKEENVRRRGVAMRVKDPHVQVGMHRDVIVDKAARSFESGTFVLNRVMDESPPPVSKVKTYRDVKVFRGNGSILAPQPLDRPPPVHNKTHRILDDEVLQRLHPDEHERQRHFEQDMYEHSKGFYDKFSTQPHQRMHKAHIETPKFDVKEINGFKGLGKASTDRVEGKAHVVPSEYNPLRLGRTPFYPGPDRPRGLMLVDTPAKSSIAPCFQYDDGVKLEDVMKREIRHPHIKQFEPTKFGGGTNFDGFKGLGAMESPPKPHGRRAMHSGLSHDPLPPIDHKPSPTRRDTTFHDHFLNYSSLSPPPGGYFHPNQAHTGIISPPRAATSFR